MSELLLKDEVYRVIGACIEVQREKGHGFDEAIYQECLEIELETQGIPFESQPEFPVEYKGRRLRKSFRPDLLCFGELVVELKALERLTSREESQLLNYLKSSRKPVGLVVNFGSFPKLEWKRMALTREPVSESPKPFTL